MSGKSYPERLRWETEYVASFLHQRLELSFSNGTWVARCL